MLVTRLAAVVVAVSSALIAGPLVLMLRRWRNDLLFRRGQPAYKDVAMPRQVLVVSALVGSALGQLGPRIVLACVPASLFVLLSAFSVFQQSRSRQSD